MATDDETDPDHVRDESSENDEGPEEGKPGFTDGHWTQASAFRMLGLGTELAGFTLVSAGIGYFIDSFSENPKPWGTAFGALIGFTLGMVRFIRQAMRNDN